MTFFSDLVFEKKRQLFNTAFVTDSKISNDIVYFHKNINEIFRTCLVVLRLMKKCN